MKCKGSVSILVILFILSGSVLAQTSQDALQRAIQIRETGIAITLLQSYPREKINYPVTHQGGTLLHEVVQRYYRDKLEGTLQLIDALVKHGADVNRRDDASRTPIFYARGEDAIEIIGHLIKHGADFRLVDARGKSVLHVYAEQGNTRLVEYFIGKGLSVDAQDKEGITPIMDAARRGKWDVVDLLIKNKADTRVTDKNGNSLLHFAAMSRNFNVVDHLLGLGLPINAKNNRGETVLSLFAASRKWSAVRVLLERGADPNVPMNYNQNLALYLLLNPELGMSQFIKKDRIDVNMRTQNGMTPALEAISRLDLPMLKKLVELGANLNDTQGNYYPPVAMLASRDPVRQPKVLEMLEYLVKQGVDINATTSRGYQTPIMIAAERGYKETVELLLKAGADIKPVRGQSLVDASLRRKNFEMAKMFLDKKVPMDFSQYPAWNSLQVLAREVAVEERAGRKGPATELFIRIMDTRPEIDWSSRIASYVDRILTEMEKSPSTIVKQNLSKIKQVNQAMRGQYRSRRYYPGRPENDIIRHMIPFFGQ